MSEITISNKKRNTILVMLSSAFVMMSQILLNTALPAIISGLEITGTTANGSLQDSAAC